MKMRDRQTAQTIEICGKSSRTKTRRTRRGTADESIGGSRLVRGGGRDSKKRSRHCTARFCLTCLLALSAALAGCGGQAAEGDFSGGGGDHQAQGGPAKGQVVIAMGASSEPEAGFDPAYGWGAGEHVHEPLIQSTLTVTTPNLDIGYDLALDMSCSEDGMQWTVHLRDDVVFSDGHPLTAEDVAFTYNTLKNTSSVNDFTMLNEAVALDETTVVFYMERPYSIWPYTMAVTGIVPQHAYGPDYGQNPVGSGRYILEQWDKGQQVILRANERYYGQPPQMERVVIVFMEEDAAFAAVKAGQVDIAYTAAAYSAQAPEGYRLLACESVDNRGFNLPAVRKSMLPDGTVVGNDVTCDVNVRRAINLALDRQAMIENVLEGYGSPAYSVCDKMPWYSEDNRVESDVQTAAQLLTEAGWVEGADGVRQKGELRAELELLYPSGDSLRQALCAETANQLKAIGIQAAIRGVGWDEAYDAAQRQPLMWGWGAHTPMEMYNIYHSLPIYGMAEYSPYANAEVDDLMDRALAASDLDEANALWKQAQWNGKTGLTQQGDIPWIWLVNVDHLYWVRDGLAVAEQKLHPHGHGWSIVNNVDRWSWE